MPNKKWKDDDKIFDYHMKVWDNTRRACSIDRDRDRDRDRESLVDNLIWVVLRDSIGLVEESIGGIAYEFK